MHLAGRNADFAAETELAAIGKLCRGVNQHDGRIDAVQEALGRRLALGDDGVGVL